MVNENKKHKRSKKKNKKSISNESEEVDCSENQSASQEVTEEQHEESSNEESLKREHSENDSETEDKPKKKKKKNKPIPSEQTEEKKGKKSIRQMKREKHAQRLAEAKVASKDQLKSQCLNYLSQWKHDKQNWKFMKAKQVWLFKNMFSAQLVPDASWPLLLEYFESAKGNIRNLLLENANKIIKQQDEWIEAQSGKDGNTIEDDEDEETETQGPKKPDETSYKRARDLIQCLQE